MVVKYANIRKGEARANNAVGQKYVRTTNKEVNVQIVMEARYANPEENLTTQDVDKEATENSVVFVVTVLLIYFQKTPEP